MLSSSINAFPNINPLNFVRCGSEKNDPIVSQKKFFLYASGRAALFHAIKASGLPENTTVLVPSFHCGVEVEAILKAQYHVEFYNIKRNLSIDFDDLLSRITKNTRVLLVIHYFGFPQNVDKILDFCRSKQLLLIEDCAHSLYSTYKNKWLGSFGAFGIYSLQKTIGLPNGGGVLCNSSDCSLPARGRHYFDLSILKSTVKSILEFKAGSHSIISKIASGILNLYDSMYATNHHEEDDLAVQHVESDMRWYYDVPRYDYQHAISGLSKPLLQKDSCKTIKEKRRKNYKLLNERLKKGFSSSLLLGEGVCPLCYVVEVQDRDRVVKEMQNKGIHPFVFGRFSHPSLSNSAYPDTNYLAKHLLGLPIHQQLNERQIEHIANTFIEIARGHL